MNRYADTEAGALEFLGTETTLTTTDKSEIIPDPIVSGCWKITNVECHGMMYDCIIWMQGYPTLPHGKARSSNNFEACEKEKQDG